MAVRLGDDLSGPAVSEHACWEAIEAVFPVIELHHYVVPEAWPPAQWLIASGGMHAGFVFEEGGPGCSGLANSAHSLSIRINGVLVGAVEDSEKLIGRVESLRWLTGRLALFGLQLRRGQMILTVHP